MKLNFLNTLLLVIVALMITAACQQAHSTQQVQEAILAQGNESVDTLDPGSAIDTLVIPQDLDYIMGKFDPAAHPDFTEIDSQYADRKGMYLRKDTYAAFILMYEAAIQDGIRLQIRSATRNFSAQKGIWEAKWTGNRLIEGGENLSETTPDAKERALKILRFSSMPGSSRHHWGTDIDLNSFENSWFEAGEGLNIYKWLQANADQYGFCQPYTSGRPYGYFEERWHWTYMPVSAPLTTFAKAHLKNEMINGFLGSESAPMIDIVKKYVLGINEGCNHQ
jgi:LAS superfamily LD-carboxypeptidase LdcB